MLTVRCPRCRHDMLCDPKFTEANPTVVDKKKRCVFCGMTFNIHSNQVDSRIVCVGRAERLNLELF